MLKIQLKLKAFHPIYLDRFIALSKDKLNSFEVVEKSIIFLPKQIERFTVLRSPHVDKKARDQFERITYKRVLNFSFELKTLNSRLKLYRILKTLATIAVGVDFEVQYITL